MIKNFVLILAVLFSLQVAAARAAEIIVVTENVDKNLDRIEDDQELIDWLRAEGHSVDVRRNTWDILNSKLIAQLNAADLIIVSRLANSGSYHWSDEPTQWNSVKTPLLLMSAYFVRNNRWNWVNSETATNNTPNIFAEAIEPEHPIFRGVPLMSINPSNPEDPANVVQVIDPLVGSGITSFIATADMGNGRLIATPVGKAMGWIAEWDAGVEFYEGAGQFAGGKRMLFCAGTQETDDTLQGEFNLTEDGRQMLRNAIKYLLGGADIILITQDKDLNEDGLRDDYNLEEFLRCEGHFVDVRPYYWRELDQDKIARLNAADLIIFSRLANSAYYDDGDEPAIWNSLTTPLLQMNAYFARNIRWEWTNTETTTNDTVAIYLEAVEPTHPIFDDVPLTVLYPENPRKVVYAVPVIDPNVASGITSFIDTTNMGYGRLIAMPAGLQMGWIAEWDPGVEFFEGAGQYTGGRRMLFCAGTQEIEYFDPVTQQLMTTAFGELNLTSEGLQMFRNAIAYLLSPESEPDLDPEP